jgi:hypothetical protein
MSSELLQRLKSRHFVRNFEHIAFYFQTEYHIDRIAMSGSGVLNQEPLLFRPGAPADTEEEEEGDSELNMESDEEGVDDREEPSRQKDIREMQQAINQHHPFGLKIWKPSLYKKFRSVQVCVSVT